MASLYRKPCVDSAISDIGYISDGLWNKYAERLDECDFFAGCGKKNGQVDYCGIAYCYWLFLNVITDDGDIDDNDRKYMVHYAMYQSDSCCTSAGCTQQANAYKDNDAWSSDPQDLAIGYQVFFQKSNGAIYHTGMCVDWDDNGIYTVEANVDSRQTLKRFYPYSEFGNKIAGFGIPRFDGYEIETSSGQVPDNSQSSSSHVLTDAVIEDLARRCIEGEFGNFPLRKQLINSLGYGPIYSKVQSRVNMIVYGR